MKRPARSRMPDAELGLPVTSRRDGMEVALLDNMSGHPDMSRYIDAGYDVVTF
ncbi:MAG TPA: hypothetical protein PLX02_11150 [Syntrophorhabdaceae bacterium]|nr:hypothetical protein [Syntrophorhabdaceae bacterium]HQM82167.1 hypothetical protein [Syntrophorhabdaceae bacterium]